jgi:hypothetical protein
MVITMADCQVSRQIQMAQSALAAFSDSIQEFMGQT